MERRQNNYQSVSADVSRNTQCCFCLMMYDGFKCLAYINLILNPFEVMAMISMLVHNSHVSAYKMIVMIVDSVLRWIFFALWLQEDSKNTRQNMAQMLLVSAVLEFMALSASCVFTGYYAYEAFRFTQFYDLKLVPVAQNYQQTVIVT